MPNNPLPHFESWRDVPPGTYLTKTQLGELELPRTPGDVAATVDGWDYRDKKATFDLYRIDESQPTGASAKALSAARARSTGPYRYECTDCGGHPELPVAVYEDGPRLCRTCSHIRRLRILQADMRRSREHLAEHVHELLAGPLAVAHFELIKRGHTPSGAERSPAAVRVHAVDAAGVTLIDNTIRLLGPRSKGVPDHAVSVDEAALPVREALADRVLVYWPHCGLGNLRGALRPAWKDIVPSGYGRTFNLLEHLLIWRADLDPDTCGWRGPVAPGRADRMLYLLQQITASTTPDGGME